MDKNSSTYKTILLAVVCSLAGACLAAANAVTKPIINENKIAAVKTTLDQFYPGATFTDVTSKYVTSEYDLVDGIYEAEGKGYIFTLHNTGYSSSGFTFAISFDMDGSISGYMVLEQNETKGKGSLAFDQAYTDEVTALTSSDAMPLISGATITTTAVGKAVTQAETIFNSIVGITAAPAAQATATPAASSSLGTTNFASQNASCKVSSEGVYTCEAKGFNGTVTATVTVKNGAIVSITGLAGADNGDGVGDDLFKDGALSSYAGATLDSTVDVESGATYTSKAIQAMAAAALNGGTATSSSTASASSSTAATSGATSSSSTTSGASSKATAAASDTLGTGDYTSAAASCTASSDGVYACKATGFSNASVSATITVKDGAIVSIADLTGTDMGDGVGDTWYSDASVFNGATLDSSIDAMSGATFTSKAVKGMAAAALKAAAGK